MMDILEKIENVLNENNINSTDVSYAKKDLKKTLKDTLEEMRGQDEDEIIITKDQIFRAYEILKKLKTTEEVAELSNILFDNLGFKTIEDLDNSRQDINDGLEYLEMGGEEEEDPNFDERKLLTQLKRERDR